MESNKLQSIQVLRGAAVLGVVAFHLLAIQGKYLGNDALLPGFLQLGQSGVDLFFVISGFVMVTVTAGRFGSGAEMLRFLWSRAARIYPTYWFYYILTLVVFLIQPAWVNSSQGNQADLIRSFLLLPDERLPLVLVAWSLIHELWFYLVFAMLMLLRERMLLMVLLLWATLIAVFNVLMDVESFSPAMQIAVHPFTLEFLTGAVGALLLRTAGPRRVPAGLLWGTMMVAVFAGLPVAYALGALDRSYLIRAVVFGTLYGGILLPLTVLEQKHALRLPGVFALIGDISYTVYLSHVMVLSALGRAWAALGRDGLGAFALVLMVVGVLAYGWIGYRLIEYPLNDLAHRVRAQWFARKKPAVVQA